MKGFPNYLVSVNHFGTNDPLDINTFRGKNWTKGMIALLGAPVKRNDASGIVFFPQSAIATAKQSPEFVVELRKVAERELEALGGMLFEDVVAAGCEACYDLNKHIKAKKFTAATNNKAYDLKTNFIWYLYDNGFVSNLVFETDTLCYRFVVEIAGKTYVWHQPINRCKTFVPTTNVPQVVSDKIELDPAPATDSNEALRNLERVVLSLFLKGWDVK
jgi:hypothetical protein